VIAILIAAQIAAAAPSPAASRFELPNGLRVWVQQDRKRPIALVQVTYKVGSLHENAGMTGVAHYVEHMLYRATTNVHNEDSYGYIDRIGGRYTGGTWPEVTKYSELVPSWALESALRITAERMTSALFDSLEFERERSNVVTEANGYADQDPLSAFNDLVMQAAFELHPYRYNSNTWARDNLVLTRAEAYEWYKRYYGPNNAVLAVVGDVDPDSVRALVIRHFGALPRAPESGRIRVVEPPQRAEKRVTLVAPGVTKRLEIVYRAPQAAHADYPMLVMVRSVLGMRLVRAMQRAGHQGETWTTDSASQYPFVFRVSIPAEAGEDLERLLAIVQSEIDSLATHGVPAAELADARNFSGVLMRELPDTGSLIPPRRSFLSELADSLTAREAELWEVSAALRDRIAAATRRVTSDDISAYAKRWLRTSQRTVGFLLPGENDFEPRWTDERTLVGDRIEIPPLTTPPAARMRPQPVPARALQPLAAIQIPNVRRVLDNGVVVRVATTNDTGAAHVRVAFTSAADSAAAAELIARDTSLTKLRAQQSWQRTGTGPRNGPLTVAVAAPSRTASLPALMETTSRLFARLPRRERPAANATRTHQPGEERIPKMDAPQVVVTATLPGVPRTHPDRRASELLNYIVGVPSYGGRLGWALTKTGLTYSSAAVTTFRDSDGLITLRTTSDTRNTDSVIQAIREVVEGVGERGVDEWELREAQAFTLGRTLLYGAREDSDASAVASALAESELAGVELLDLPALSRAYLSVTLEDVNRAARRYYRADRLRVVATGAVRARSSDTIFPAGTFRRLFFGT